VDSGFLISWARPRRGGRSPNTGRPASGGLPSGL